MTHARSINTILLYPCTIVDYVRIMLVAGAVALHVVGSDEPEGVLWRLGFAALVGASSLLDILDGYLARRLNHTSRFGMLLDLGIDMLTNTLVWGVLGWYIAVPLLIFEWTVSIAAATTALRPGAHWKVTLVKGSPRLITRYFRNNQRNLLSAYSNVCHSVFPMALYVGALATPVIYLTTPGLIVYELVTLYMLYALGRAVLAR